MLGAWFSDWIEFSYLSNSQICSLLKGNYNTHTDPELTKRIKDHILSSRDSENVRYLFADMHTILRQEVGKYDGDTIVTSRELLGDALKTQLQNAASAWSIQILKVEIEELNFDEEVTKSLSDARIEELKRRAELVSKQAQAEQLS